MLWIGMIILIVGFEYFMKKRMEQTLEFGREVPKWNGKIILKKYHNKGAALNLFEQHQKGLIIGTALLIGALFCYFQSLIKSHGQYQKKLGLSLLIGGALSNIWDRISRKYVVDYFSFSWKKIRHIVFNIADFCIFLGSILFALSSLKEQK